MVTLRSNIWNLIFYNERAIDNFILIFCFFFCNIRGMYIIYIYVDRMTETIIDSQIHNKRLF